MEDERLQTPEEISSEQQPTATYHPRPAWQIWAAWIGLAIVITGVVLYYIQIARGGM